MQNVNEAETIKASMIATGQFSNGQLDYINEDFLTEISREAKDFPLATCPDEVRAQHLIYTGNHLVIDGKTWYWKDQVGSQCGTSRSWRHLVRPGDSYVSRGKCPQGYPWYELNLTP